MSNKQNLEEFLCILDAFIEENFDYNNYSWMRDIHIGDNVAMAFHNANREIIEIDSFVASKKNKIPGLHHGGGPVPSIKLDELRKEIASHPEFLKHKPVFEKLLDNLLGTGIDDRLLILCSERWERCRTAQV